MHGEAKLLLKFLDGSDNRYIIPVYQRNYDWQTKQCEQLYNDLIEVIRKNRKTHFFGSIVTANAQAGGKSDYLIIDGQQRITTISILFTAMVNLMHSKIEKSSDVRLEEKIRNKYLVDEYSKEDRKLRLKPIKDDCSAFDQLITNDKKYFFESSNITQNYYYFYNRIQKNEISIDELYEAIWRLEIIDIFLNDDDNPQLIFESLNSTGLDLTEGDKIRNFILMGLKSNVQERYYENYWNKIEKLTNYDVSSFVRNYLTLVQKKIPNINAVYFTFKDYVQNKIDISNDKDCEEILKDLLYYAEIYNEIITATVDKDNISAILSRLNLLDMTVTYPFLFALFNHQKQNEISSNDVKEVLDCIESYSFRRIFCPGHPTNALNKIFCRLDSEVMKIKEASPAYSYSNILKYCLLSRTGSGKFPDDTELSGTIPSRDVYHMNKKNREYLFDRLENGNTKERVQVVTMMENRTLTIEHIMPQTLSEEWKKDLGPEYERIKNERLHTLTNLTLTGYNSMYSNNSFSDKKTVKDGFKDSHLNLNSLLLNYHKWTETEMDDRQSHLLIQMKSLWPYPKTTYIPPAKKVDTLTLDDDIDFTGRTLISYSYGDITEHQTSVWAEMFIEIVKQLYKNDSSKIRMLAADKNYQQLTFAPNDEYRDDYANVADDVYVYKKNSTLAKIKILEKLFDVCGKDKSELIFNLKPEE